MGLTAGWGVYNVSKKLSDKKIQNFQLNGSNNKDRSRSGVGNRYKPGGQNYILKCIQGLQLKMQFNYDHDYDY